MNNSPTESRVRGGGRWFVDQSGLVPSNRNEHDLSVTSASFGFRVASAPTAMVKINGRTLSWEKAIGWTLQVSGDLQNWSNLGEKITQDTATYSDTSGRSRHFFRLSKDDDAVEYSDWSAPVNLGPVINSGFEEFHTVVSKNGLSLYFGSDRPGGFSSPGEDQADLYVSQRANVNDPWGTPVNIGPIVNSAWGDGRPSLSRDEHWMFFQSNRPGGPGGGADIWVSWRPDTSDDFGWQQPAILGAGVNSDAIDSGPTYFENERGAPQLYFTSFRLSNPDIYLSELAADGTFGSAQLVTELSGPTADAQPSIRPDGLEIFFHSNRDGSQGLDLWVATRKSTLDPWSTQVNLGPTINTLDDERFPFVSSDGETLYFTSGRPGGFGTLDLYKSTRTKLPGRSGK